MPVSQTRRRRTRARAALANHLCFEEANHGFGECVIVRVTATADGGLDPRLQQFARCSEWIDIATHDPRGARVDR